MSINSTPFLVRLRHSRRTRHWLTAACTPRAIRRRKRNAFPRARVPRVWDSAMGAGLHIARHRLRGMLPDVSSTIRDKVEACARVQASAASRRAWKTRMARRFPRPAREMARIRSRDAWMAGPALSQAWKRSGDPRAVRPAFSDFRFYLGVTRAAFRAGKES